MKRYENPEMKIWVVGEDIITTSGLTNGGQGSDIETGSGDGASWGEIVG